MSLSENAPLISVCIPSYNRAKLLPNLLDSILSQKGARFEIVICEDKSPERDQIREVAEQYAAVHTNIVFYHENQANLGYDGNLRRLIEMAHGDYVLFMGNDDLLADGALANVSNAVMAHRDVGVILRSYVSFFDDPDSPIQVFRYFERETFFPSGAQTIATFFRRCVFISGMVVHRESALECATSRFDGTLLYQQHLVGQILAKKNGVYLPQILSLHRLGGTPDFGNSAAEKGLFVPNEQTPESSVNFVSGMLRIAKDLELTLRMPVYKAILHDIGNYAYPILSIQATGSRWKLLKYIHAMARLGLWRIPLFYVYALGLLILGRRNCDNLIATIKQRLGRAPVLGKVYAGEQ